MAKRAFSGRLAERRPLLLDGATGTELERRGAHTGVPLWSSHALIECPELVERIHRDYVAAGAEVVTANTFRTQARTLARGGVASRAAELTLRAVSLARAAAKSAPGERRVWVAGSMPPLEDCYRPDLVPDDPALASEHREHARNLSEAGCDLILIETMNCIREAVAATEAARATGLPVWVSFVCDSRARLLSGEALADALAAVGAHAPDLVGINCLPPVHVDPALPILAAGTLPFGIYANLGEPTRGGRSADCTPEQFATHAERWIAAGARAIGGCCGTRPEHLRALRGRIPLCR